MTNYRKILFYRDYFEDFYRNIPPTAQKKVLWVLKLIQELERIPSIYLKHIESTEGLYEIRVQAGSDIFRIFCCFDKGNLIILMNGFQKKSQLTPRAEIKKALQIKKDYESEK